MAAIVVGAISRLAALLGTPGAGGTIVRGALSGAASIGAVELIRALQADLTSGNPEHVAGARKMPQYAIVDLHSNKVIRTLSARHVYSILTHPRRKPSRARKVEFIQVPSGTQIERVR